LWRAICGYLELKKSTEEQVLTNASGKGTPRRKVKKVHKSSGTDDKKLQTTLKKMNVQPIPGIEEVNMFKSDGNVIHFSAPKGELNYWRRENI
jgi:nascent polypeptide-associated complex subunit beta